jgi:hypothetical protein
LRYAPPFIILTPCGSVFCRLPQANPRQIQFKDPNQEWELVNAWFVKQNNFTTTFKMRDIVQPEVSEKN